MACGIVGLAILPSTPDHAGPGACKDARGVWVIAAASPWAGVDGSCPGTGMTGVVGQTETHERGPVGGALFRHVSSDGTPEDDRQKVATFQSDVDQRHLDW
jgi:hypothetical protein